MGYTSYDPDDSGGGDDNPHGGGSGDGVPEIPPGGPTS
jgi:hypothetical protein